MHHINTTQEGLHMEVRLGDDMRFFLFKLLKVECGIIKLQIDFLLDRWVTCNNKMLYHQEIPKEIPIIKGDN